MKKKKKKKPVVKSGGITQQIFESSLIVEGEPFEVKKKK